MWPAVAWPGDPMVRFIGLQAGHFITPKNALVGPKHRQILAQDPRLY